MAGADDPPLFPSGQDRYTDRPWLKPRATGPKPAAVKPPIAPDDKVPAPIIDGAITALNELAIAYLKRAGRSERVCQAARVTPEAVEAAREPLVAFQAKYFPIGPYAVEWNALFAVVTLVVGPYLAVQAAIAEERQPERIPAA